jgi:hypothetical protein
MMRRSWIFGSLAALLSATSLRAFWAKPVRAPLPGGGTVNVPSGYIPVLPGQYNHDEQSKALIAYRKFRHTLAGTWECDSMVAVSHARMHDSFDQFRQRVRGALSTSWGHADLKPGWFGGTRSSYPIERKAGTHGPEMEQEQSVHLVGFFDVYDKTGRMFVLHHENSGLMIAIWIFDSHGGVSKARKMALEIVASFTP